LCRRYCRVARNSANFLGTHGCYIPFENSALDPSRAAKDANQPAQLATVLQKRKAIQKEFNASQSDGKEVSLADLIVLGGYAAIEKAMNCAGQDMKVPITPGRTDASWEQTDIDSFEPLEPIADGFRNYLRGKQRLSAEELLVDRAQLLTLTAPEMTVPVGGLRVLGANVGQSTDGVFTERPETVQRQSGWF
jgi:catalase-peroxidase